MGDFSCLLFLCILLLAFFGALAAIGHASALGVAAAVGLLLVAIGLLWIGAGLRYDRLNGQKGETNAPV